MLLFTSAQVFTFSSIPEITEEAIEAAAFKPCGSQDLQRSGFVPPVGLEAYVNEVGDFVLLCINVEEKILPTSVVNEELAERVEKIREEEGRPVGRKERQTLKDEITFDLLPRAFTRNRRTHALVDRKNHMIIVDASSAKKAEDFCSYLREALGSLPVVPITTQAPPAHCMTHWLREELPQGWELSDYCKLQSFGSSAVHTCRNEDLTSAEIRNLIEAGLFVVEVSVEHEERTSFVVTESLNLKQIRYGEGRIEEVTDQAEGDHIAEIRGSVLLVGDAITRAVNALCAQFGGLVQYDMLVDANEVEQALGEALEEREAEGGDS